MSAAVLMMMLVFVMMLMAALAVLVVVVMLMLMAAFTVFVMLMFVRMTAFAVFVFAHRNPRKIQWLLKYSTIGRKKNARLLAQMIEAEVQDLLDVLIGKRVKDVLPLAAKAHKVR